MSSGLRKAEKKLHLNEKFFAYKGQQEMQLEEPDQHIFRFTPTQGTSQSQIMTPNSNSQIVDSINQNNQAFLMTADNEYFTGVVPPQQNPQSTKNVINPAVSQQIKQRIVASDHKKPQRYRQSPSADTMLDPSSVASQSGKTVAIQLVGKQIKVDHRQVSDKNSEQPVPSLNRREKQLLKSAEDLQQVLMHNQLSPLKTDTDEKDEEAQEEIRRKRSFLAQLLQESSSRLTNSNSQQTTHNSLQTPSQQLMQNVKVTKPQKQEESACATSSQMQRKTTGVQIEQQLKSNEDLKEPFSQKLRVQMLASTLIGQAKHSNASTGSLSPRPKVKRATSKHRKKDNQSRKKQRGGSPMRAQSQSRYASTQNVAGLNSYQQLYSICGADYRKNNAELLATARPQFNVASAAMAGYTSVLCSPQATQKSRQRSKVNSAQIRSVAMSSPTQQTYIGKHRNTAKILSSQHNKRGDVKSFAAMAINNQHRQSSSKCQSSLLLHNQGSQANLVNQYPRQQAQIQNKTPSTRGRKEKLPRPNKTSSMRNSKRGHVEGVLMDQVASSSMLGLQQNSGNPLAQSVARLNQARMQAGNLIRTSSSKRNELANYLDKILNQQQKAAQVNTYEQAQLQALSNQAGINLQSAEFSNKTNKGLSKHQIALSSHISKNLAAHANSKQQKAKKNNGGVVLLNDHQRNIAKNDMVQTLKPNTRCSMPSSDYFITRKNTKFIKKHEGRASQQNLNINHAGINLPSTRKRIDRVNTIAGLVSEPSQSSMILLNEQQNLTKKTVQNRALNIMQKKAQENTSQKTTNDILTKQKLQLIQQNLIIEALQKQQQSQSQGGSEHRRRDEKSQNVRGGRAEDAMEMLNKAVRRVNSRNEIKCNNYGKSNSARIMTTKATPKDDLIPTTEHTILNIRADQDASSSERCDDNMSKDRQSKSKSRVEYHSDRGKLSHRDYFQQRQALDNQEDDVYGSKQKSQEKIDAVQRVDVGVQTTPSKDILESKDRKETLSSREEKIKLSPIVHHPQHSKAMTSIEAIELAVWGREKQALENYTSFFVQQMEPLTRNLLIQVESQPVALASAAQQMDVFGLRHEQAFAKDELKDCIASMLFHKMSTSLIMSFQKLAKFASEHFIQMERTSQSEMRDKEDFLCEIKDQLRQHQKDLFISKEKLNLSEQMKKLKEKEVLSLRNKIQNLIESLERQAKEQNKVLQKKQAEQEINFTKYSRELKYLYEQNKELFELNKQLREDNKEQEERMLKIINAIKKYPNLVRDIENQLDQSESLFYNKENQQTNTSHQRPATDFDEDDSLQIWELKGQNLGRSPKKGHHKHGTVFVGQNKVEIPKFDLKVIEKYNQLNIKGELPHIVETEKFDPKQCTQNAKSMLKGALNAEALPPQNTDHSDPKTPSLFYMKGVAKVTPISNFSPSPAEQNKNFLFYHDSSRDMSGGERKHNAVSKVPSVKRNRELYQTISFKDRETPNLIRQANEMLEEHQKFLNMSPDTQSPISPKYIQTPPLHIQLQQSSEDGPGPERRLNKDSKQNLEVPGYATTSIADKQHQIVTLQNQLYQQLMTQKRQVQQEIQNQPQPENEAVIAAASQQLINNNLLRPQKSQSSLQVRLPRHPNPFIMQKSSAELDLIPEYQVNPNWYDDNQAFAMLQQSSSQTGTLQLTSNVAPGQNDTTSLQQTNTQNMVTITQNNEVDQPYYGIRPAGATLQDQISKQYSPISKRLESISHFSKSAAEDLSKTAGLNAKSALAHHGLPGFQMFKIEDRSESDNDEVHNDIRLGLGELTSIEDNTGESRILVEDEESTQKRFIEPSQEPQSDLEESREPQQNPYQPSDDDQLIRASRRLQVEQEKLQLAVQVEIQQQYEQGTNQYSSDTKSPLFDPQSAMINMHYSDNQTHTHEMITDKKDYEFDGGHFSDAPLDISRVDDNFDQSNQQKDDESADFLENQNFADSPFNRFDQEEQNFS